MPTRTFEQWVDCIFDHPVADPAWHWAEDADTCVEPADVNVEYLTRLFAQSGRLLARFSDAQVNQGLNLIVSSSCSDHGFTVANGDVPWPKRRACIAAIYDVYAQCFAGRCAPVLSHLDAAGSPLNYICYMWWDVFPAWVNPEDWSRTDEASAFLAVMERCLSIPNAACVEGALHGLGHWQLNFPERVEAVIDGFLRRRSDLPPDLVLYAQQARAGNVA